MKLYVCVTSYLLSSASNPKGIKVFPFRVAPFSEGSKTILTELPPSDVYQFLLRNVSVLNFSEAPSNISLLETSSSEGVEPHDYENTPI